MTILFAYDGSESADAASAAAGKLLGHLRSNVDGGHARLVVALAAGRGEFVQACDQLDAAGGRVLFDAGDPLVPGIGAMSSPASSQAKAIYPIFDEASAALDRAGQSCPRISPVQNASPQSEGRTQAVLRTQRSRVQIPRCIRTLGRAQLTNPGFGVRKRLVVQLVRDRI
jgi:hypothetical protein